VVARSGDYCYYNDPDERTRNTGSEVRVYGVHWPRIGVLIVTIISEKFDEIFGLPHLTWLWDYFTTS
jgi:hypothetical protein